jgi:hypothetical protein
MRGSSGCKCIFFENRVSVIVSDTGKWNFNRSGNESAGLIGKDLKPNLSFNKEDTDSPGAFAIDSYKGRQ